MSKPNAVNPLDEVRAAAQRAFPTRWADGARTALCLSGGASGGRTDLIHLHDAGVGEVLVADRSSDRLDEMRRLFPDSWEYRLSTDIDLCRALRAEGRRFDLVVCDGSAGTVDHLWSDLLPLALGLTAGAFLAKATVEYLAAMGREPTREGLAGLVSDLHGIELLPRELILRSSGRGGTYWVVFVDADLPAGAVDALGDAIGDAELKAASFDDISYGKEMAIELRDLLDAPACAQSSACSDRVNAFRSSLYRKESQSIYRAFTSRRFRRFPAVRIDRLDLAGAVLDLERFSSMDDVLDTARRATSKKGTVNRRINRAERAGYYVKPFAFEQYVPDVHAIHYSTDVRGGKGLRATYRASIEDLGGPPTRRIDPQPPSCAVHFSTHWGVFREERGHRQGDVVTNEQLVGYIHLAAAGNHCWYSRIMGHAEHLQHGIMDLLHFSVVERLLRSKTTGLRYVCYVGWNSGPRSGSLQQWKRHALFEPRFLIYDEAGDWKRPQGMTYLDG